MTEIDYYLLGPANQQVRELFAIKLAEKAFKNRLDIYLHAEDESHANHLDQLLWRFRRNSFLPHQIKDSATTSTPIIIGFKEEPVDHHQLLINLSNQRPGFFSSFDRMLEIVIDEEPTKTNSRENYRFFKERGYKLAVHQCQAQAEAISQSLETAN